MKAFIPLFILFFLYSFDCHAQSYSFFIAGHVYGTPGVENVGFHPPFKAKFEYIQGREEIEFGVFLGDLVYWGSEEKWDNVVAEFDTLGLPCYIAVGNHDMINPASFYAQFGDTTYYSFSYNNDLFIILDPNIDSWNISGEQLTFLQNTLSEQADSHDNIFVMMHQLLWWAPDNQYSGIILNSTAGRDDEINFWTEIEPLFHELDNQVIMCAGDVAATNYASDFMYDNYDNITYIATGMGYGVNDNFIIINISAEKEISYELICLNSEELYCFGVLEDYEISLISNISTEEISLYPNPASDVFSIDFGNNTSNKEIFACNLNGEIVYNEIYGVENLISINTNSFASGVYFVEIKYQDKIEVKKLIILKD
ncbi:MAG: T9SS type A sorting domain-containing protein, partial [Bacteroidales bacterium]|nr:T9SS type A sorting domain-containing protein [Bacteroidales bacterium]